MRRVAISRTLAVGGAGALVWGAAAGVGIAVGSSPPTLTVVQAPADRSAPGPSDPHAVALMARAARAARSVAYTGVQSVTQWSPGAPVSVLVHVTHVPGVGLLARSAETADVAGGSRQRALLDEAEQRVSDLSVTTDQLALLRSNYQLSVEPSEQVVGRTTDVVTASRRPVVRARFWLDRRTGLLLRRELYDDRGRLARESTFLDVTVLAHAPDQPLGAVTPMRPPSGRPLDTGALAAQTRTGFHAPGVLPDGYRLIDARLIGARDGVLHLTYCDGLTTLSVFEQRGRLDSAALPGWRPFVLAGQHVVRSGGMPERVAWSAGGLVYTLVSGGTDDVLDDVVGAWPHEQRSSGVVHRLGRGLARIGSWLNPFA